MNFLLINLKKLLSKYSLFLITGVIALFLSIPFLYKEITHGFRINKLYVPSVQRFSFEQKDPQDEIFSQPFYYLGRGMQFFVFESKDKQFVIKLFKQSKAERLQKTLQACRLAFDKAREETGILSVHLEATSGEKPLVFMKNRIGVPFSLPLDSYAFVVQKKVQPFKETLLQAIQEGSIDLLIDSYLQLIHRRSLKGICNTDILLNNNFGFLDKQAVEIDFGNYVYSPENKEKEFWCFVSRMRRFLKKHAPEYLSRYDEKVALFSCNE